MNESKPQIEKGPKKKILLADDDRALIAGVKLTLEDLGYQVLAVSSAEDLLNVLYSGEKVDAVITDNNMGGMDGIEAVEELRKEPAFENLPIVLHSGGGNADLATRAQKLGVHYLQKPYGFNELEGIMDKLLKEEGK